MSNIGKTFVERIRRSFAIARGLVDQANGDVVKNFILDNPSAQDLKDSIVPANCLKRLDLLLHSGRESYRISHTQGILGGVYVHMQSNTDLADDFEEVKERLRYHCSLGRKLKLEVSQTEPDVVAREFLTAHLKIQTSFTSVYLGELIERYEREFRVSDSGVLYENLPRYALRRIGNDASSRKL